MVKLLNNFNPSSRRVRQGDPISPLLFVLCIERLFHMINVALDENLWNPITLSRGGPKLAYLAFVDDILRQLQMLKWN